MLWPVPLLIAWWNNCILFHTTGTSIRRHRIPLPPPNDEKFYTVYDFNISIDVVFYGRTFKIYDCNLFTKNFLTEIGVGLNLPGKCPDDPYTKMRREVRSWYIVNSFLQNENPFRSYRVLVLLMQMWKLEQELLKFSSCLLGWRELWLSASVLESLTLLPLTTLLSMETPFQAVMGQFLRAHNRFCCHWQWIHTYLACLFPFQFPNSGKNFCFFSADLLNQALEHFLLFSFFLGTPSSPYGGIRYRDVLEEWEGPWFWYTPIMKEKYDPN